MKRSAAEHAQINRMLQSHGLPPLESGHGLMAALGFLIDDHEHFRSMLARCDPEERPHMYDSLTPYLKFKAKPLDVYIAESAERAERLKLPTLDPDGKDYHWPEAQNVVTDRELNAAQEVINKGAAESLTMTCRKCTRQKTFKGDTVNDCVVAARLAGWVYFKVAGKAHEICPKCPAVRPAFQKPQNGSIN